MGGLVWNIGSADELGIFDWESFNNSSRDGKYE
jgi:hypothetical protein